MIFSNYYKDVLSSPSVPHLNVEQHRRLLNILGLEQELKTILDLKEKIKSSDDLYKLYVKGNR